MLLFGLQLMQTYNYPSPSAVTYILTFILTLDIQSFHQTGI